MTSFSSVDLFHNLFYIPVCNKANMPSTNGIYIIRELSMFLKNKMNGYLFTKCNHYMVKQAQ